MSTHSVFIRKHAGYHIERFIAAGARDPNFAILQKYWNSRGKVDELFNKCRYNELVSLGGSIDASTWGAEPRGYVLGDPNEIWTEKFLEHWYRRWLWDPSYVFLWTGSSWQCFDAGEKHKRTAAALRRLFKITKEQAEDWEQKHLMLGFLN